MFKKIGEESLNVTKLDPAFVASLQMDYRNKYGNVVLSITHALGLGTIMADYHVHLHTLREAYDEDDLADVYFQFVRKGFYEGTTRLDMCTVGIADRVNKRDVYVMVNAMGDNYVIYQKSPDEAPVGEVAIIASPLVRRSMRMYPTWKDGNTHDKVMMCSLLGFEYDSADDEILTPHGMVESAMTLSNSIGAETLSSRRVVKY